MGVPPFWMVCRGKPHEDRMMTGGTPILGNLPNCDFTVKNGKLTMNNGGSSMIQPSMVIWLLYKGGDIYIYII